MEFSDAVKRFKKHLNDLFLKNWLKLVIFSSKKLKGVDLSCFYSSQCLGNYFACATTLSITTFTIMTLRIQGLLVTFSIMTLSIMALSIMTISITTLCHYAECHCAASRILFIVTLNVIMLSVLMLNVAMVSVVAPLCTLNKLISITFKIALNVI